MKIDHINDLCFNGYDDAKRAVRFFVAIADQNAALTVKWDGNPTIVLGQFPDGRPFISNQSFFNKKPLYYLTAQELQEIKNVKTRERMLAVWNVYKNLLIGDGFVVGEFLFDESTLKNRAFKPSVLHYHNIDEIGPFDFNHAKVGVAWHTFNGDIKLNPTLDAWAAPIAVRFDDLAETDIRNVTISLSVVDALIEGQNVLLKCLQSNPKLSKTLKQFIHTLIAEGMLPDDPMELGDALNQTIEAFFTSQYTDNEEKNGIIMHEAFGFSMMRQGIVDLAKIYLFFTTLKYKFMARMRPVENYIKVFDKNKFGSHEGFIARTQDGTVKLVNQNEFNFVKLLKQNAQQDECQAI